MKKFIASIIGLFITMGLLSPSAKATPKSDINSRINTVRKTIKTHASEQNVDKLKSISLTDRIFSQWGNWPNWGDWVKWNNWNNWNNWGNWGNWYNY